MFLTYLLRVIVLQTDLEVHSLGELPLLVSAGLQHSSNTLVQSISGDLTHLYFCKKFQKIIKFPPNNLKVKVGMELERITFNNCAAKQSSQSHLSERGNSIAA